MPNLSKRITKAAAVALCDIMCVGGAGAVSYGASLVYVPAGFIIGGIFCLAAGVLGAIRLESAN